MRNLNHLLKSGLHIWLIATEGHINPNCRNIIKKRMALKCMVLGSSLVAYWLEFGTFTAVARVQSLVGELKFCKPCLVAKKKKKRHGTEKSYFACSEEFQAFRYELLPASLWDYFFYSSSCSPLPTPVLLGKATNRATSLWKAPFFIPFENMMLHLRAL